MKFSLPYPPTLNTYWRNVHGRTLISKKGRDYRSKVCSAANHRVIDAFSGRLTVVILVYPPDKRRRDLDNLPKAILDSLEHAGVYENDSQIDKLMITRREVEQGGRVEVYISKIMGDV